MGKNVFANGNEISCKKDDNKSIAAMADVCLSPPSPPAGPVPLPYPNTAKATDTDGGSRSVNIGGNEVGQKNSSNYKKSTGDEAATKTLGMGVVSHNIQGKMKHAAWSFDVKIEGANAIRHMDLTTHNHINCDNVAMTLNQAATINAQERELTCEELKDANAEARENETGARFQAGGTLTTAYRERATGTPGQLYMKAMCPQNPLAEFADAYQPGIDQQAFQPDCTGSGNPRRAGSGRVNDAENKLLHPEMAGGFGGKIKMSTWHPPGDAAPCYSCRQSICEAEACNIEVWLCKSDSSQPEAVRPAAEGLCPPQEGQGDYDPAWQDLGLGPW
jgi:hypothetical protein